jgi:hypothetical protein
MKLSTTSIKQLDTLLQTVALVSIDKLIITKDSIRGIDEKKSVVIITDQNVPDFGDLSVGLNRLGVLSSRLNLVKGDSECGVEAIEASKNSEVSHLQLTSSNAKVQCRCASVESVKGVPKAINDKYVWTVTVPYATVPVVLQAASAMGAENAIIVAKNDGVSFEFVDSNQDVFSTKFAEEAACDENQASSFVFNYPVKSFLPLLKAATNGNTDVTLNIGERGILSITVNGYAFMVLPSEQ